MPEDATLPPILDDLPAQQDCLDFEPYVDALADILCDPGTHTPLTLGVFGTWGSGKTSLMTMLAAQVAAGAGEGRPGHRTVWFNAWKYHQEIALWRALLLALLDNLEQLLRDLENQPGGKLPALEDQPTPEKLLDVLREALYRDTAWSEQGKFGVNWADLVVGLGGLATSVVLTGPWQALLAGALDAGAIAEAKKEAGKGKPASDLGKVIGAFRREEVIHYQAQLRSLEQFQANFSRLVQALLRGPGQERKLVVFIDDLDRCLSDKALQVLEALKLFLDVEGCISVLGLDPEAIQEAIRTRYQDRVKARAYLEKIIQLPFILPPIEEEPMRRYVAALAPALPDPRCAEVFALGLAPNPRQVKRTINVFLLLSRLVARRPDLAETITPVRLAKIVAIQDAHPDLYDLLRLRPGYLSDLEGYFRAHATLGGKGERGGDEQTRLPEALRDFAGRDPLRRLLTLLDDEEARFDNLKPQDLRSYITLTRRATPAEVPVSSVARLPFEPEMVAVPAGPFLMGTGDEQIKAMLARFDWAKESKEEGWFSREQPQHEVTLPAFEIGRYPVTNAEYAAFVQAAGHAPPSHWSGGSLPEGIADHPVVNVTWRDAGAYVAWLAGRSGQPYRLPTEAEWEKAARGSDARLWPWGNEWDPARANCKPQGPGTTTPVGQYSPAGDSPCGCADMAGNVWEWCSSLWGSDPDKPAFGYPYRADDGREDLAGDGLRVLRGGSWYNDNPGVVRCAYRFWDLPGGRIGYLGFRVARGSLR